MKINSKNNNNKILENKNKKNLLLDLILLLVPKIILKIKTSIKNPKMIKSNLLTNPKIIVKNRIKKTKFKQIQKKNLINLLEYKDRTFFFYY